MSDDRRDTMLSQEPENRFRNVSARRSRIFGVKIGGSLRQSTLRKDFLTLNEAAGMIGKTTSNISYLIQYDRLRRYDSEGKLVQRAAAGGLRVSRTELLSYMASWKERIRSRMEALQIKDMSLAFHEVPERDRTKHVHRLHPYLGKFIPQLVEHFLSKYFTPGRVVIDPFSGSGTTLVQASEAGVNSIGIDVSEFNVMISKVKLEVYDIQLMQKEVNDITRRTTEFSSKGLRDGKKLELDSRFTVDSDYLNTWFAPRSLQEILHFRSLIPDYHYQDLLRVLLSRTARSCRLVHHYDLATPREPVHGPYICYKHRGKECEPVRTIIPRLTFYSRDTARRVADFAKARKPCVSTVVEDDSRYVRLDKRSPHGELLKRGKSGIFTSPPYVGQIDYHEQHRYAYELFDIGRKDYLEIGPKAKGKGERAKAEYSKSMIDVLSNMKNYLSADSAILVVANDKFNLYPEIFEGAGMLIEESFRRPVEDRTERDKRPYSETVFLGRLDR